MRKVKEDKEIIYLLTFSKQRKIKVSFSNF